MYVVYSLSVADHRVRVLFMNADLENSKAWLDMYVGHQLVSADPSKHYHVVHVDAFEPAQIHLYCKRTIVKPGYVWDSSKEKNVLETVFGVAFFGSPEPYARWQKPLLSLQESSSNPKSASGLSVLIPQTAFVEELTGKDKRSDEVVVDCANCPSP